MGVMIFGQQPSFKWVLDRLAVLEKEANKQPEPRSALTLSYTTTPSRKDETHLRLLNADRPSPSVVLENRC